MPAAVGGPRLLQQLHGVPAAVDGLGFPRARGEKDQRVEYFAAQPGGVEQGGVPPLHGLPEHAEIAGVGAGRVRGVGDRGSLPAST